MDLPTFAHINLCQRICQLQNVVYQSPPIWDFIILIQGWLKPDSKKNSFELRFVNASGLYFHFWHFLKQLQKKQNKTKKTGVLQKIEESLLDPTQPQTMEYKTLNN